MKNSNITSDMNEDKVVLFNVELMNFEEFRLLYRRVLSELIGSYTNIFLEKAAS